MNTSQLKILTGFMATIAVLAAALLFVGNKGDSEKVSIEDNQQNVITAKVSPKKDTEKTASAKDIDDFFKTVETKKEGPVTKSINKDVQAKKKTDRPYLLQVSNINKKFPFKTDWLYDGNLFKASFNKLQRHFIHISESTYQRRSSYDSKLFPNSFQSTINYTTEDGLTSLIHELKPFDSNTKRAWLTLKKNALNKVSTLFGGTFTSEFKGNGVEINKALLNNGLVVHSYFLPPNSYANSPNGRLIVAFSDSFKKIPEPNAPTVIPNIELRAFANFIELNRNWQLDSTRQEQFFTQIHSEKRNPHIIKTLKTKVFYSPVDQSSLFSVKISDEGFPIISDPKQVSLSPLQLESYLKWTVQNGKIKQVDVINGSVASTICKTWHHLGHPKISEICLPGYSKKLQYVYGFSSGRLSQIYKISSSNQEGSSGTNLTPNYKILEYTYLSRNINYTFNAKKKLIRSNFKFAGNSLYQYTDDPQYRESSHKLLSSFWDNNIRYNYEGKSKLLRDDIDLGNILYGDANGFRWKPLLSYSHDELSDNILKLTKRSLTAFKETNLLVTRDRNAPPLSRDTKVKPTIAQNKEKPPTLIKETNTSTSETIVGKDLKKFFTGKMATKVFTQVKTNDFEAKYMKPLDAVWTDDLKRSARTVTPLDFNKSTSLETIFQFRKKKLNKIVMMFYNKGDEDVISKNVYISKLNTAKLAVKLITGTDPFYKPNAGLAKNFLYWWKAKNFLIKLEANYTETRKNFSSEYIRLSFSPIVDGLNQVNIDKANQDVLSSKELLQMITKTKDGSVVIQGIPMVDQGAKGYCACAATARVLNYYGKEIDQHDIAKLASSSAMGTDPDELKKALEVISSKLRLHTNDIVKCYMSSDRDKQRFEQKLERTYKKLGYTYQSPFKVSELQEAFKIMSTDESRYKDFKRGIIRLINKGQPVVWALMLGIIPESDVPQARGGHMRLIIGYNEIEDIIFYTDSWGAGHELKAMKMTDAFWVSMALWEIRPR
ncbi:MAG: C39 family peptidase [Lentisphaeraceae bacterium]|nr:C39 family peptidase [Lentisphaeraceae bacterium]